MISSGWMIAGLVVVAVAVVVIVILARMLLRRRDDADPGIGVTLPSGAVLNPSSTDRGGDGRTAPAAPAYTTPRAAAPAAPGATALGGRQVPDDVVRLVSEGRTAEAVAALMAAAGRQDPAWAQRAVDVLSKIDLTAHLGGGSAGGTTAPHTTTTRSTTISWSNSANSASGSGSAHGQVPTASSFSGNVPDDVIDLVRQGRAAEAEARIRAQFGIDADRARILIETISKLPF